MGARSENRYVAVATDGIAIKPGLARLPDKCFFLVKKSTRSE